MWTSLFQSLGAAPTVGAFLRDLTDRLFPPAGLSPGDATVLARLDVIFAEGTLAQRLLASAGRAPDRGRLRATYAALCDCLHSDSPFRA